MAQYEVMAKFFAFDRLYDPSVEEDQIVDLPDDFEPPIVLKPLDASAERAVAKRNEREAVQAELNRRPNNQDSFLIPDAVRRANPNYFKDIPVVEDAPEPTQKKRKSTSQILNEGSEDELTQP